MILSVNQLCFQKAGLGLALTLTQTQTRKQINHLSMDVITVQLHPCHAN